MVGVGGRGWVGGVGSELSHLGSSWVSLVQV